MIVNMFEANSVLNLVSFEVRELREDHAAFSAGSSGRLMYAAG